MQIALATQPESISTLTLRSFKLYLKGLPRVFIFSLLLSIIVFLPRLFALIKGSALDVTYITQGLQRIWLILLDLGVLFVFTSMLWRMRCVLYQEHESLLSDMSIAIRKLPFILVAALIQSFIFAFIVTISVVFGYYLSFNPMMSSGIVIFKGAFLAAIMLAFNFWLIIYAFYAVIFYLPLILTEDKGIIGAFKQSISLVWGEWWRTVCFLLIPWVCYLALLTMIQNVFNLDIHIYFLESINRPTWFTTIINILIFAIFVPWVAASLLTQLRDLELRKKVG